MGRLKAIEPRLKPMGSRLLPARTREESEAQRFKDRDAQRDDRKWYYSGRWKKLRQEILIRDSYTCQKTGIICVGRHPAPNSPVVDHIRPHRGDEALFWDRGNLQTVSKEYHDREKQSQERRGNLGRNGPLLP